jgi:hypothetical protein
MVIPIVKDVAIKGILGLMLWYGWSPMVEVLLSPIASLLMKKFNLACK